MVQETVFGSHFDRVVVINLDRRPDRMSRVAEQLGALNIRHLRHLATDGNLPEVRAQWQAYLQAGSPEIDVHRQVRDWQDFYLGDKPRASRVAFFEANRGPRAISTPGAWGLFMSMRAVIEKAVSDKVERLLILEDDVIFHRDTIDLWPKVSSELPDDWQILQLGAMQTHWDERWMGWHSQHLYKCNGSSFAAHAIGLKRRAMEAVLQRARAPDLPFDIGPLTEVKRMFRNQCYTVYPNIAIQDGRDTEIGMSKIFFEERAKRDNVYRWNWADYGPSVLRPVPRRPARPAPKTLSDDPLFLQPYGKAPDSAERVMIIFGPNDPQQTENFIRLLSRLKAAGEVAPIVLIDDLAHIPALRAAGLAFEYVPTPETYAVSLSSNRDVGLVIARRLSILRRKWRPRRIMALGEGAGARLELWRRSPFEQAEFGADLAPEMGQVDDVTSGASA